MFERYTESARRVVFFAREDSLAYGSRKIETEHLLLGIIRDAPHAGKVMGGTTEAAMRESIEGACHRKRQAPSPPKDLPLSYASKRALSYAAEEAELLGELTIGPQHLLLGLLREPSGLAAQILAGSKVTLEQLRKVIAGPSPTRSGPDV